MSDQATETKPESQVKPAKVRLIDIENGSRIDIGCPDGSTFIIFDHIDGMYSYCTTERGGVLHLNAMCPLEMISRKHFRISMEGANVQ